MRPLVRLLTALLFCGNFVLPLQAQLNTDAYFKYLDEHKNMTAQELLLEFPAGVFAATAPSDLSNAEFFSAIDLKYKFTPYEKELTAKHGFMVTERLSFPTYAAAFADAYVKDLPVYISSDAILHALHRSYDNMLADIETYILEPQLFKALLAMKATLKTSTIPKDPLAQQARLDADIYLTVALQLIKLDYHYKTLNYPADATFPENTPAIEKIRALIEAEQLDFYPIFAQTPRHIDFSQMKPRGHYPDKGLSGYFQAMMWLGRTEIFITKPEGAVPEPSDEDIKRQCMLAVTLANLAQNSGAVDNFNTIDKLITKFVGAQDNLSLSKLIGVNSTLAITSPDQLRDDALQKQFQDESIKNGAQQQILSQLLWADAFKLNSIKPAAAFMLMGQRFIFDSYILGNVVFDKVGSRMMPSPLDAMFVLGNDASIQLLQPEIEKYEYAKNLAGLRYLSNSQPKDFWEESLYSTWLSGIRSLNPPKDRSGLPRFMQTGAWWQKTLNTQLGSWAELRHDNLLYGKQSYTGGNSCFYPKGYVEPMPELYATIARFGTSMKAAIAGYVVDTLIYDKYYSRVLDTMRARLDHITTTCTTLSSMAEKELRSEPFNEAEHNLIENWAEKKSYGCGNTTYQGVYPQMMYGVSKDEMTQPNFVVADVHTQPTDLLGAIVGKVLHVGTSTVNMALIIAEDPSDSCSTAYIGPVGSYYEHITDDFYRLNDEEWKTMYYKNKMPTRPAWVYSYLASDSGKTTGEPQTLVLGGVAQQPILPGKTPAIPISSVLVSFTPNPISSSAILTVDVPPTLFGKTVVAKMYSSTGEFIRELFCTSSGGGKYSAQWDGTTSIGTAVASGAYLVRITIGETSAILHCTVTR
ncbi:MAG: DUF3160 domain-containing protein [Ignavibacteria bacterium]|nr:DUF3160 domain-containing protein [Ignavibacteria bacterium]